MVQEMDEFRKNLFTWRSTWRSHERLNLVSVGQKDLKSVFGVCPEIEGFDAIFVANNPNIVEESFGSVGQIWRHHPDYAPVGKKNILSALSMILRRY